MTITIPFNGRHRGQPHLAFSGMECPMCGSNDTRSSTPLRYQDAESAIMYADSLLTCVECEHQWPVGHREAAWKGLVRAAGRAIAVGLACFVFGAPALSDDRFDFSKDPSVEIRPSGKQDGSLEVWRGVEHQGTLIPRYDGSYRFERDLGRPTFHIVPGVNDGSRTHGGK